MHLNIRVKLEDGFDVGAFVRNFAAHCDRDCAEYNAPVAIIEGYDAYEDFLKPVKLAKSRKKTVKKSVKPQR
jgi:hypothetical protein